MQASFVLYRSRCTVLLHRVVQTKLSCPRHTHRQWWHRLKTLHRLAQTQALNTKATRHILYKGLTRAVRQRGLQLHTEYAKMTAHMCPLTGSLQPAGMHADATENPAPLLYTHAPKPVPLQAPAACTALRSAHTTLRKGIALATARHTHTHQHRQRELCRSETRRALQCRPREQEP